MAMRTKYKPGDLITDDGYHALHVVVSVYLDDTIVRPKRALLLCTADSARLRNVNADTATAWIVVVKP